jgi:hypothetical protein
VSQQSAWSIAYMRENFPAFRDALLSPKGLDMLAWQGHKINWAWVNDVETTCACRSLRCRIIRLYSGRTQSKKRLEGKAM